VGQLLEVLVQRSNWCNGFEVRMVYAPMRPELLGDDAIVRRYVAAFSRGDAEGLAALFAPTASLLESFTRTETGDPYRHDGREAVLDYYRATFTGAPWRAMQITSLQAGEQAHTMVMEWEYMDPRLAQPVRGRNHFTLAAGEIFEAQIELLDVPVTAPVGG
jgi:ketosteroid isomerase-like protein